MPNHSSRPHRTPSKPAASQDTRSASAPAVPPRSRPETRPSPVIPPYPLSPPAAPAPWLNAHRSHEQQGGVERPALASPLMPFESSTVRNFEVTPPPAPAVKVIRYADVDPRADAHLAADIQERFDQSGSHALGAVKVAVSGRVATLSGTVPNHSMKHQSESLANQVRGLKAIVNQLEVMELTASALSPDGEPPGAPAVPPKPRPWS